jgi:hypothetical protein
MTSQKDPSMEVIFLKGKSIRDPEEESGSKFNLVRKRDGT